MCSNQKVINKTIVILGLQEVGKSTILRRYVKNRFQDSYKETIGNIINNSIGVDYYTKNISGKSSKIILSIWDTNGDEINRKVLPLNIYFNSSAFLIVCSYDKKESVELLPKLISFIEKIVNSKSPNHFNTVPIIILVNKCEVKNNRQFKFSDVIKKLEGSVSKLFIYEVSAKDNVMINHVFNLLIKLTIDNMLWPAQETSENTKYNTNEFTNFYTVNNGRKSFLIARTHECDKEKCNSECCK